MDKMNKTELIEEIEYTYNFLLQNVGKLSELGRDYLEEIPKELESLSVDKLEEVNEKCTELSFALEDLEAGEENELVS